MRTFAQINSTLVGAHGRADDEPGGAADLQTVQQQLPSDPTLESFSSANQVGVAQLAIQYCNVAVNTPTLRRSCSRRDLQQLDLRRDRHGAGINP